MASLQDCLDRQHSPAKKENGGIANGVEGAREATQEDEDPDVYIRSLASTWGHVDLVKDWLPHHKHEPDKIARLVLWPAAMYGQLEVLLYALPFGNLEHIDNGHEYPGWSLMHFAVEGIHRVFNREDLLPLRDLTDIVPGSPKAEPKSQQDILHRQLDIILALASSGAPLNLPDRSGLTPSARACFKVERKDFLEGAMLLDILSLIKSREEGRPDPPTPGLSYADVLYSSAKTPVISKLTEWAYTRQLKEHLKSKLNEAEDKTDVVRNDWATPLKILTFMHQKNIVDLSATGLTLSQSGYPLPIAIIRERNWPLLRVILESEVCSGIVDSVLNKVYEYDLLSTGQQRESVLSYACRQSYDGDPEVIKTLLSPQPFGVHLTSITLCSVGIRHLPIEIFHPNLINLNVKDNNLDFLPVAAEGWNCPKMKTLVMSGNNFMELQRQIFHLPKLMKLDASCNQIGEVHPDVWTAPSLQHLDLNQNCIIQFPSSQPPARNTDTIRRKRAVSIAGYVQQMQPRYLEGSRECHFNQDAQSIAEFQRSHSGFSLTTLDLSNNRLKEVPAGLSCLAPILNSLKLGNNEITNLGVTSNYPRFLTTLDLSNNVIETGMLPFLGVSPVFQCHQSPMVNNTPMCSHMQHQQLTHLKFLYLQNNELREFQIEFERPFSPAELSSAPDRRGPDSFMLFPNLQGLRLTNNRLDAVPENVHTLPKLCELAIDNNPAITHLPLTLHRLSNLFVLKVQGISDPIVSELKNLRNTPEVLLYLRARETSALRNTSMRLFIIGHHGKGKTTLLNSLRGKQLPPGFDQRAGRIVEHEPSQLSAEERQSTVGIECSQWVCAKKKNASRSDPKITFYTWDFAGQEEYYSTHQCFLVNRALYVLVWNVNDGEKGIESLGVWLQNLHAKTSGSNVVIVGSHLDCVPSRERKEKCRYLRESIEHYISSAGSGKMFPSVKAIHFVGCQPKKKIEVDSLNDIIYNVAANMYVPKDGTFSTIASLKIKIIEEMIPRSYELIRNRIGELALRRRNEKKSPVMKRDEFCNEVKDILSNGDEVETAVEFLSASTGVILHFNVPSLKKYYIIDPQCWFDLCALVISPDSVSNLVRNHMAGDSKSGQLSARIMDTEFRKKNCNHETSMLIREFLREYRIIHRLDQEFYLVPSAIDLHPNLKLEPEKGCFPRSLLSPELDTGDDVDISLRGISLSFEKFGPAASCRLPSNKMRIRQTGLVYRRILVFPPIPSGVWSMLISLFIQNSDFEKLIQAAIPGRVSLHVAARNQLRTMIGDLTAQWQYWKSGILFTVENVLLLRVNSLYSDKFTDPQKKLMLSETQKKLKHFCYREGDTWAYPDEKFSEAIEVIIPEVRFVQGDYDVCPLDPDAPGCHQPLSARILTKALEIIDEVFKSYCENLAIMGIYSTSNMLHFIPCPLCFGDDDGRPGMCGENGTDGERPTSLFVRNPEENRGPFEAQAVTAASHAAVAPKPGSIFVFTVAEIIKKTLNSDHVMCQGHGRLDLSFLTPDLVFADIPNVKLDKKQLSAPLDRSEEPDSRGSFAMVVRRCLHQEGRSKPLDVAVKIFEHFDYDRSDSATELVRNYSDMRYELNRLVSLSHAFIVQFIGVFTNPHCFVLEWAPEKTLEHIRSNHLSAKSTICPTSIVFLLLQVTSALDYLHSNVGIVHNDLKLSNILAFRFPPPGHHCHTEDSLLGCEQCLPDATTCGVVVKLADMGICANPTARKTRNHAGIRQFVPECLSFDASLTEKVDIFTLGTSLYELMSLRGLPSEDIGEIEYKNMLQSGTRPQFSLNDPPYPLIFFIILKQCWQQEYFKRPSASSLHDFIVTFTGYSIGSDTVGGSPLRLLMDTFVLHESYRLKTACTSPQKHLLSFCAALQSPDENKVAIVQLQHPHGPKEKVNIEDVEEIHDTAVTVLHMASTGEILVGCENGNVIVHESESRYSYVPTEFCSFDCEHGAIVGLHYNDDGKFLIMGFSGGEYMPASAH